MDNTGGAQNMALGVGISTTITIAAIPTRIPRPLSKVSDTN